MTTDIFIRAKAAHFPWLRHCLRSIYKFASGFRIIHLCVPSSDEMECVEVIGNATILFGSVDSPWPAVQIHPAAEWPGKEFLHSMWRVMNADTICKGADYILHCDSDCLFVEPFTPEDFIIDEKPMLIRKLYSELPADCQRWQKCVRDATGLAAPYETMVRHPEIYIPETYVATRYLIKHHTGMEPVDYIYRQQNSFPQTYAEHPTLGAVALELHPEKYHVVEHRDAPPRKLLQFWSHAKEGIDRVSDCGDQISRFGGMRTNRSIIEEVLGSV